MGKLNGALRIRILERDGYACVYCGRRPPAVPLEVDHVVPRVHGGRDEATNLVTACFDCNNGKRAGLLTLPDTVVLAPIEIPISERARPPIHGHGYLVEANLRWPDDNDMWDTIYGQWRYATVAWCAGLTVRLWPTAAKATNVFAQLRNDVCGHSCWNDHEIVDLAVPQALDRSREQSRGLSRLNHFRNCDTCTYLFSGQAPLAALRRMQDRMLLAVA